MLRPFGVEGRAELFGDGAGIKVAHQGQRAVLGHIEAHALDGMRQGLRTALSSAGHEVLAVEMEGAAVAQVCHDYGLPFAAMRTISDRADDSAHVDFPAFVNTVATRYAEHIIQGFLQKL